MEGHEEVEYFQRESKYRLTDFIPLIGALRYQDRTGNAVLLNHPISKTVERKQAGLIAYTLAFGSFSLVGLAKGLETFLS